MRSARSKDWFPPLAEGKCPTGKVRYATKTDAREALSEVQVLRLEKPTEFPPERDVHFCRFGCEGWHLTSRPPELPPEEGPMVPGETWEDYAHRLERRIKSQRDHIGSLNALRADAGNRTERKRMEKLRMALGEMTERWYSERVARLAMVEVLKRHGLSNRETE